MTSTAPIRQLARGGVLNVAGTVIGGGAGIALVVLVTNGVRQDIAGMLFAATSFFLIVTAVSALGTDVGLAHAIQRRLVAGSPASALATVGIALRAVIALSVAVAVVVWVAAPWFSAVISRGTDQVAMTGMLRVLALALPIATAYDTVVAATLAYGTTRANVVVEKLGRMPGQILCVLVALLLGVGPTGLAIAWAAPYLLGLVAVAWWCRRIARGRMSMSQFTPPTSAPPMSTPPTSTPPTSAPSTSTPSTSTLLPPSPSTPAPSTASPASAPPEDAPALAAEPTRAELAKDFWAFTAPRALGRICQVALQRTDIVLVAALLSPRHAAVYTAATRFLVVGQMGMQAIQQVLAPQLSKLFARGDLPGVRQVFSTSTAWLMAITWPVYLTSAIAAPLLLRIFGSGYESGLATVVILSLTMLATTATGSVDVVLLMAGRSRQSLVNNASALVIDVILVVLLVPPFGITGAALAWAAALLVRNVLPMIQVRRAFGVTSLGPGVGWVAFSAGLCFGGVPLLIALVLPMSLPVVGIWLPLMCVAYAAMLWRGRTTLELAAFQGALPGITIRARRERRLVSRG
ncbi:oligosaccharide flippase family protein [Actinopolymorpha sp. B9G3]|uniref:oligosaccharide flippase family protein n=1 Tax=Actinopolymorpha sp. B9G3 TaxID=3158970 RepID=UPI0032D90E09